MSAAKGYFVKFVEDTLYPYKKKFGDTPKDMPERNFQKNTPGLTRPKPTTSLNRFYVPQQQQPNYRSKAGNYVSNTDRLAETEGAFAWIQPIEIKLHNCHSL